MEFRWRADEEMTARFCGKLDPLSPHQLKHEI